MKKTKIISLLLSINLLLTAFVPGTFAVEDTASSNTSVPAIADEASSPLDSLLSGLSGVTSIFDSIGNTIDDIGNTFDDIGDFVTSFSSSASANDGDADTNNADDQQQCTEVCDRCGQEDCICCTECNGIGTHETTCSAYQTLSGEQTSDTLNEYACSCEYPPESGNISDHAESCVRKTYILSQFNGKTSAEIYAQWETYDEATRADILQMVSVYDSSKYNELIALIENGESSGDDGSDEDIAFEEFEPIPLSGLTVGMSAQTGVFPEGTVASVTEVDVDSVQTELASAAAVLGDYLSDYTVTVISQKIVDISFTSDGTEVQPDGGSVYVTFDLTTVDGAENVAILHIKEDDTAELMAVQNVNGNEAISMTVETNGFSHYVVLESETTYKATLMRDELKKEEYGGQYEIVTFPVTLNDFVDANAFNEKYPDGLHFTTGASGPGMNKGSLAATIGIVQNKLSNGYPVLTQGIDNLQAIFNTTPIDDIKQVNTPQFEFIYNKETGYYTYNSGANHAQLNKDTNTVELYADTMAPFNYKSNSDYKLENNNNVPLEENYYKVVVDNPDAWYHFYSDDLRLEYYNKDNQRKYSYSAYYLRLYSSYQGKIECRILYSDSNPNDPEISGPLECKTGEWADYVFDIDPERDVNAVYIRLINAKKEDYILFSSAGFLQTVNETEVNYAGLYPFNVDITQTYAGSAEFDANNWMTQINNGENEEQMSSRVIYNRAFDSNLDGKLSDGYVYFSMAMEFDFYIPESGNIQTLDENGKIVNSEDIIFNFNGDDDMWVFVDGELALDIGGAHTYVGGEINFTDGITTVENYRNITDTYTDNDKDNNTIEYQNCIYGRGEKQGTLDDFQYTKGTYHKIQIFYMERAGTNSNCLIKFNLPIVPKGNVVVSKQVVEVNGDSIDENLVFTFQVTVDEELHANKNYTVESTTSRGVVKSTAQTDENGKFTLQHNQSAFFDGIAENSVVTVTEITPTNTSTGKTIYKSTTVSVGGNRYDDNDPGKISAVGEVAANSKLEFAFVNTYQALTDIVIEKTIKNGFTDTLPENQTFFFHVQGTDNNTNGVDLTVAINISVDDWKNDSKTNSVTIKNVPKGNYTVTEDTDWAWRYTPDPESDINQTAKIEGASYTFGFKNDRTDPYWLSGDSYCENWWGNLPDTTQTAS